MTSDSRPDNAGAQGSRRITIKVPETYREVNEGVWNVLEDYLFQGFLTSSSYLLGKTYVFKTINHHEMKYISHLRPINLPPPSVESLYRASFIAHSIFIADGNNLLHNRPDHIAKLIDIFRKVPEDIQDEILSNLRALNSKAMRLQPLTEVYVNETRSRYRWLQMKNIPVHSSIVTGISGTQELGMNYVQQTWVALNRLLDQKDTIEADWTNAKFIGSCFNGKGVRSVDERDRGRKEKERVDREDLKMQVLYRYLNRKPETEDAPTTVKLPDGRMATVSKRFRAESVDELADQLSVALSGEKDLHDAVVERQVEQLTKRREALEQERQKIYRGNVLNPDTYQSTSMPHHGPSRVLGGQAEAEALIKRVRQSQTKFLNKRNRAIPGDLESPDGASFIEQEKE